MTTATKRVSIALSKEERQKLEWVAKHIGLPMATVARMILGASLGAIPEEALNHPELLTRLFRGHPANEDGQGASGDGEETGDPETAAGDDPGGAGGHSGAKAKAPLREGRKARARGGR